MVKAPAKGKAKKQEAEEPSARENKGFDKAFAKKVHQMKEGGSSVPDIIEETGESKGSVLMGLLVGRLKPADFLKDTSETQLKKDIVRLREKENLSWGEIAARALTPESKIRSLFLEATGKDSRGHRVEGKGGRPMNGETKTKPVKAAKKTTKASKKTAASDGATKVHISDMNLDQLQERLNGKEITIGRTGKKEKVKVKNVKSVKGTEMTFVEQASGKSRTIDRDNITRVSAK